MAREAAPKARARTLLAIPQTAIIGVAMNYDHEIRSLAAETLATQTILAQALFRLSQFDPGLKRAITEALNDAANIVEHVAIEAGAAAHPAHTVKALQIVEEIRTMVLGGGSKPKHAV